MWKYVLNLIFLRKEWNKGVVNVHLTNDLYSVI